MSAVAAIAASAFREHTRRRFVLLCVLVSAGLTVLLVVAARDPEPATSLVPLAALGAFQLLALLATLAVSMHAIGPAFASGEAAPVLARAVARWQFVAGRLLAALGAVGVLSVLATVQTQVVQVAESGRLDGAVWLHGAVTAFNLAVVASATVALSALMSSGIVVAATGVAVYVAAGVAGAARDVAATGRLSGGADVVASALWYATPKLLASPLAAAGRDGPGPVVWALAYVAAMVAVAVAAAHRREA